MANEPLPVQAARLLSASTASSLSHASLGKIIATGLLLGVVHVMTGRMCR